MFVGSVTNGRVVFDAAKAMNVWDVKYDDGCINCEARWHCAGDCPAMRACAPQEVRDARCAAIKQYISRSLFMQFKDLLLKEGESILEVFNHNEPKILLLKQLGYKRMGVHK